MSLADELKVINEQQEAREENKVDYPSSHLKNNVLRLSKKTPKIACRILPAVSVDAPTWQPYRELWVTDNKGKYRSYMVTSDTRDEKDPLLQAIKRWDNTTYKGVDKNGNAKDVSGLYKLSKYGNFPGLKYYLNVIPLEIQEKNGVPYYTEVIKNGNYEVHMLSINGRLLNTLATDLQDRMHNPNLLYKKQIDALNQQPNINITQEQIDNSFISDIFAYPVVFNRIDSQPVSYSMELQQQQPLRPLKSSWKDQAEDLVYQATPSYEYNRHWVDDLITRVDHELGLDSHIEPPKQPRQASSTNTATQATAPSQPKNQAQTKPADNTAENDPFAGIGMQDPFGNSNVKVGIPDDTIDNSSQLSTGSDDINANPWDTTTPTDLSQANATSQTSGEPDLDAIPEDDMPFDVAPAPQSQAPAPKQEPQANNSSSQTIDDSEDSKTVDDILGEIGIDKDNPLSDNN